MEFCARRRPKPASSARPDSRVSAASVRSPSGARIRSRETAPATKSGSRRQGTSLPRPQIRLFRCRPLVQERVPPPGRRDRRSSRPGRYRHRRAVVSGRFNSRGASRADLLHAAREAADNGRLEEADALCGQVLSRDPASAEAHYLRGVVRQAQGQFSEAQRSLEKALYLDPRHYEALVHMMLLGGAARRRSCGGELPPAGPASRAEGG